MKQTCLKCNAPDFPGENQLESLELVEESSDPNAPFENRTTTYRCPACNRLLIRRLYESGLGKFSESWERPD